MKPILFAALLFGAWSQGGSVAFVACVIVASLDMAFEKNLPSEARFLVVVVVWMLAWWALPPVP